MRAASPPTTPGQTINQHREHTKMQMAMTQTHTCTYAGCTHIVSHTHTHTHTECAHTHAHTHTCTCTQAHTGTHRHTHHALRLTLTSTGTSRWYRAASPTPRFACTTATTPQPSKAVLLPSALFLVLQTPHHFVTVTRYCRQYQKRCHTLLNYCIGWGGSRAWRTPRGAKCC